MEDFVPTWFLALSIPTLLLKFARRCTDASFVLVARDPLNRGSAFINPLEVVGEEEEKLFKFGEESKVR